MSRVHEPIERRTRVTVVLAAALMLTGCGSTVITPDNDTTHNDSATQGGGGESPCPRPQGRELLSELAEANSDERRPGPPAVAIDGERFLVVSPEVPVPYAPFEESAVVGALVSKEHTVEARVTIVDGLSVRPCRPGLGSASEAFLGAI